MQLVTTQDLRLNCEVTLMKTSYKLFGIYWDHKSSVDFQEIAIIPYKPRIDYKAGYCLFDIIGEFRAIKFSELLSVETDDKWISICTKLKNIGKIAIEIDYVPFPSEISSAFFLKKLCQIYYALQHDNPDSQLAIQIPPESSDPWQEILATVSTCSTR